jgi:hypothetical protein
MSSVALLFMIDPGLAGIKGFAFFGDTVLRAARYRQQSTGPT